MIAPEGKKILLPLGWITVITAGAAVVFMTSVLIILTLILALLVGLALVFFRDPEREIPTDQNAILAPADGRVVQIRELDDQQVGPEATLISIFLSVFNVHVNRVPVTGIVQSVDYQPGKFLAAFKPQASQLNEHTTIILNHSRATIKIKQIAGVLARRILCYAEPGKRMHLGSRLGYIMFGSRTDIIIPGTVQIAVHVGQKVTGGETILGRIE